jgi:tRNA(fMet)-specific endonuclease VapC
MQSCSFTDAQGEHDRDYAVVRRHLEVLGAPIGPYDLQVAAIALANGCTMVTHNTVEFSGVPGLVIEDRQQP